jgi:hypothetical protein
MCVIRFSGGIENVVIMKGGLVGYRTVVGVARGEVAVVGLRCGEESYC